MTFHDLLRELQDGKTFEKICQEQGKTLVKYDGNAVYLDTDLEKFLEELGAEIFDFSIGYAVIDTKDGSRFEVPYKDVPNRFDNNLPDETILCFEFNKIYDVTGVD